MNQRTTTESVQSIDPVRELSVGIKLDTPKLGTPSYWDLVSSHLCDMARELELGESISAGTGFGVRDMQWEVPMGTDEEALIQKVREFLTSKALVIDHVDIYEVQG